MSITGQVANTTRQTSVKRRTWCTGTKLDQKQNIGKKFGKCQAGYRKQAGVTR